MSPVLDCPYRSPLAVAEVIKPLITNKVVCELGCASGDLLYEFSRYAKYVVGIENRAEVVQEAINRDYLCPSYISKGDVWEVLDRNEITFEVIYFWMGYKDIIKYAKKLIPDSKYEGVKFVLGGDPGFTLRREIKSLETVQEKFGGEFIEIVNKEEGRRAKTFMLLCI